MRTVSKHPERPGPTRSGSSARAAFSASLLVAAAFVAVSLGGCTLDFRPLGPPRWSAAADSLPGIERDLPDSEPAAQGSLQIDGRRTENLENAPIPYYGLLELDTVPAAPLDSYDATANRTLYRIEEPVTPWVFPFDFVLELVIVAFSGDPDRVVAVPLAAPASSERDSDATLEALTSRARLARTER